MDVLRPRSDFNQMIVRPSKEPPHGLGSFTTSGSRLERPNDVEWVEMKIEGETSSGRARRISLPSSTIESPVAALPKPCRVFQLRGPIALSSQARTQPGPFFQPCSLAHSPSHVAPPHISKSIPGRLFSKSRAIPAAIDYSPAACVSERRYTMYIRDLNGLWVEGEILPEAFVQAFKLRFTVEQPPNHHLMSVFLQVIEPCVTSSDNENLLAPVSDFELECAIKSIGPLKAPGPNGLHAVFYQKCWDKTKHLVKSLVNDFHSNNIPLQDINHNNIALIPKVASPESVNHFRPISLCNVSYKIITKIIVSRLRPILSKCISKNQGAFAPGRSIFDNILIAHELFHDFKRKRGSRGAMATKLDLEKAYDLLDWKYIRGCLDQFGFSNEWFDRIMNCVSSTSFSMLINGSPYGHFNPSRGIRQGDLLSPYIFILCMEPFVRHFNLLAQNPKTNVGLLSSQGGDRISNLVFADDGLICARSTAMAAKNINCLLDNFSKVSGQRINLDKSTVYFSSNVHSQACNALSNLLHIQHKTTLGRYLGIHNIIFWKDHANAKMMIDRIRSKFVS
ncbi:hypothetical protein L3X38_017777 [Prunus dulcis]|uniref:Reverse transcriptase domain-containing protein n=1 Tax=Prunus dulcis TaxID=3755 RepID=A0AAD4WAD4_PRUDU|nr:hypothetical protein L3X38_017777 [Prunus dulcis]